jgi:hypothetical protein
LSLDEVVCLPYRGSATASSSQDITTALGWTMTCKQTLASSKYYLRLCQKDIEVAGKEVVVLMQ